jgi:hypothetical protein
MAQLLQLWVAYLSRLLDFEFQLLLTPGVQPSEDWVNPNVRRHDFSITLLHTHFLMKNKKSVIVMPRENAGNVHENLRLRQALVARLTLCDNQIHGHENLRLRQALVARLTLCDNQRHGHENLRLRQALVTKLTLCDNQRHGHENLRPRQACVTKLTLCDNQKHGHALVARQRSCVRKCRTSMRMPSNTPRNCKIRASFFYAAYAHMKEAFMKWRHSPKI